MSRIEAVEEAIKACLQRVVGPDGDLLNPFLNITDFLALIHEHERLERGPEAQATIKDLIDRVAKLEAKLAFSGKSH